MNPSQASRALVTGAGSGIGRGIAQVLAERGLKVVVNDRNDASAQAVAAEVGGIAAPGDVRTPGAWLHETEPLSVLVHNAGYDLEIALDELDLDSIRQLFEVQLFGPLDLTSRLLPNLRAAEGALVVFVGSVHATATLPKLTGYAAAKGALRSAVRALAQELGPSGVRVIVVSPGFIETPLHEAWITASDDPEATRRYAEALHPGGRIGTPREVGELVAYLASPAARFITGTEIVIDGGLLSRLVH